MTCAGVGRAEESVGQRVAAAAEKVLRDVRQTTYQHKIDIDVAAGRFDTDCSGFVEFVLHEAAPSSLAAVVRSHGRKRPLAEDFYETFHDATRTVGNAWQPVDRVVDVMPGDVIAWKIPTHEDGDHTDTGHVMVIASPPTPQPKSNEFGLVVIDSTKSPHDQDSRKPGETGVGRGTIYLETDERGHVVGYHWKNPDGPVHDNSIAIGRPSDR